MLKKRNPKQSLEAVNLYDEIAQIKETIDIAHSKFQYAVDPDLIDCYIYEVNAAWKKYQYLLKKAKDLS